MIGDVCTMLSQHTRRYGSDDFVSWSATASPSHFDTLITRCFRSLMDPRCTTERATRACSGLPPGISSTKSSLMQQVSAFTLPLIVPTLKQFSFVLRAFTFPLKTDIASTDRSPRRDDPMLPNGGLLPTGLPLWTVTMKNWFSIDVLVPRKTKVFLSMCGQMKFPSSASPVVTASFQATRTTLQPFFFRAFENVFFGITKVRHFFSDSLVLTSG
mmetsp:Transcript_108008/g.305417  ORF Transcript_108008/g.305417 Transcript_108008/m.305417 type:complete len:214 (-) Transcript_108008:714-1355(-)